MSAHGKAISFALGATGSLVVWAATVAPALEPEPGSGAVVIGSWTLHPLAAYTFPWGVGVWAGALAALAVLRARRAVSLRALGALVLGFAGFLVGLKLHVRLETLPPAEAFRLSVDEVLAPGARLPLGLVLGGALALTAAAVSRAGWREVGDAWAVAASLMIPVGRIGCMLAGCCFGRVCGRWLHALCVTYAPGTPPYAHQVAAGLLAAGSPASLPLHPLPLYFAAASLLTLGILLWELRRRAPAGTLLATFCVLRPAAKLLLEPLRAEGVPGPLMVVIPATVLVVTTAVLAGLAIRRPGPSAARRPDRRQAARIRAGSGSAAPAAAPPSGDRCSHAAPPATPRGGAPRR